MTIDNFLIKIKEAQKQVEEERDKLSKISTVLYSLRTIANYLKTGNPYEEVEYD